MRKVLLLALAAIGLAACNAENESVSRTTLPEKVGTEIADVTHMGATRSYKEALAIAEQSISLLESGDKTRAQRRVIRDEGQCVTRSSTRSGGDTDTLFYIFNFEDNAGFSVIAANRAISPIIAVTEQGNYTYGEPTGVEPFDEYMTITTENVSRSSITPPDTFDPPLIPDPRPQAYSVVEEDIISGGPLITTKWGQTGLYGLRCPNGISGCAATALLQVMAYYQHPATITYTYYTTNHFTFISWDRLLSHTIGNVPNSTCTSECNHALIGNLMREVGYRMGMIYGEGISIIEGYSGLYSTIESFGYTKSVSNYQNGGNVAMFNTIRSAINAEQPLIITGSNDSIYGHAWIVDGYKEINRTIYYYILNQDYDPNDPLNGGTEYNLYDIETEEENLIHFNWGWDGDCDGYFSIDNLAPNQGVDYDDDSADNDKEYDLDDRMKLIQIIL